MGTESAHVIVRSPVRANRSPRREAAYVRTCALRRIAARPTGRAIRPSGHRRVRRAAHSAPRRTADADGEINARTFLVPKGRADLARSFGVKDVPWSR